MFVCLVRSHVELLTCLLRCRRFSFSSCCCSAASSCLSVRNVVFGCLSRLLHSCCIHVETDMSHASGVATLEHIVAFLLVSMQLLLLSVLAISLRDSPTTSRYKAPCHMLTSPLLLGVAPVPDLH